MSLEHLFIEILNMSLTASAVILAVLLLRLALRRAPRIFSYALWAVVLFRLLCPFSFTSGVSLLGFWQEKSGDYGRMNYISETAVYSSPAAEMTSVSYGGSNVPEPGTDSLNRPSFPDPAAVSAQMFPLWLRAGARVWALGVLLLLVCGLVSCVRLRRRLQNAVPLGGGLWQTGGFGTPFVFGLIRPRIYIPAGVDMEHADYIILHERIHIRRGDHIFRLLACLALCLHWFNPLVWLACTLSGRDMEMSCDEAVLQKAGTGVKKAYSASLLALAAGEGNGSPRGVPLAFGEREPETRIRNVLRFQRPAAATIVVVCLICLLAAVLLLANPRRLTADGKAAPVYYGVVKAADAETGRPADSPYVILIPGLGEMEIPDAETVEPYIEIDFSGLEPGQLVRIVFPEGTDADTLTSADGFGTADVTAADSETVGTSADRSEAAGMQTAEQEIAETAASETISAGRFTAGAEAIQVVGVGFDLLPLGDGRYLFSVPIGMAEDAREGDRLLLYRRHAGGTGDDTAAPHLFADTRVVAVDAGQYDVWVTLSAEEAAAFLSGFGSGILYGSGSGISCKLERAAIPETLTPDILRGGAIPDGSYLLYPRSFSRSARGFDLYVVPEWPEGEELPFLSLAEDCTFLVNRSFETLRYEVTGFDEFAELLTDGLAWQDAPVHAVFTNGRISQAALESAFFKAGISYMALEGKDSWYDNLPTLTGLPASADALTAYYRLIRTETADVSDARGAEQIDIYTGNIGDGDSGIVLVRYNNEEAGQLSFSLSAHCARAGWNNIYAGELDETGYLLTVHVENRETFGEYSYQVFRLGSEGQTRQIAGSSFRFYENRVGFDEDLFRRWCGHLDIWLANSHLLLSSQEGELRTDPVSDAERYSFQTLDPINGRQF